MTATNQTHLKVGDAISIVEPKHRGPYDVHNGTVIKVARKYLTVEYKVGERWVREEEFERGTGLEKRGDYTSYRMFLIESEAAYRESVEVDKLWNRFRRSIDHVWHPPAGMTREKIATAMKLLNIELKEEN